MSTEYTNISQSRFAEIARLRERVFHARDLANLWRITNKNTLHTTLSRYTRAGLLIRIYKGLYSLVSPEKINPYLLGVKALHSFAYVSTESVLFDAGIIFQKIHYITLVSAVSKKFTVHHHHFRSRQLADRFLYLKNDIYEKEGVLMATVERAIADLLYFQPHFHFDNSHAIHWKSVNKLQKELGYI